METYDIIILAGQSNAEGQGIGPVTREYAPDARIMMMTDDAEFAHIQENGKLQLTMKKPEKTFFSVADERVVNGEKMGCFALQFAKNYADNYLEEGRKVLIIYTPYGSTCFFRSDWGVGNCMHERMVSMTREALSLNPDNRVVAMLWSQGEHDADEHPDWDADRRYCAHKKNLEAMTKDLYQRLGQVQFPVIACGFTDENFASDPVNCGAILQAVKEWSETLGGYVDTAGLLPNRAVVGGGDYYHFCRESLHLLGGRFFEKYREIRK